MSTSHILALLLALLCILQTTASSSTDAAIADCAVVVVGAGLGGAYSAWRLSVNSGKYDASHICVFEAKRRPGGRIFSIRDPVPGFEGFVVDVGAYRFHRTAHRHMRLLVENALGFTTQCYTDPLDRRTHECGQRVLNIVQTRGMTFGLTQEGMTAGDVLANYSDALPYVIPKEFQWGFNKPLRSARTFGDFLAGPHSVIAEIAIRWDELISQTEYETAMRIADEIIDAMKTGSYQGTPYSEVSLLQAALNEGYSYEEMQYHLDANFDLGENFNSRISLELHGHGLVRFIAQDLEDVGLHSLVMPVQKRDGVFRRIGMQSIVEKLLRQFTRAGGRVFYEHKATSVKRVDPESASGMVVTFENGRTVKTGKVILNMGKPDLIALGVESEPMKSGQDAFRKAVERVVVMGLSKMYCFWDDAWWLNKLKTAIGRTRMSTSELFNMRYHDGHFLCEDPKNLTGCRGGLLVSYVVGDNSGVHSGMYARSHNRRLYTPLTNSENFRRLLPGRMTKLEQLWFKSIHRQLRKVHQTSFENLGMLNMSEAIPESNGCVYADWFDVGVHGGIGPGQGETNVMKLYTRPVEDLQISLVNEAWGSHRGWAESSVNSAESALYHEYHLDKPQWMDETFHDAVIVRFNRGSVEG